MNLEDGTGSAFTKKERLMMSRERDKLDRTLGGIRTMTKLPAAVWIVDTKKEHLAVDEARKLGIPIIAILDTNADPDEVDYAIPGNDDAIRAVGLLTRVMADAVADGLVERATRKAAADDEAAAAAEPEPLAEWELEVLTGDAADAATPEPQTAAVAQEEAVIDGPQAERVSEVDAPAAPEPEVPASAQDIEAAAEGELPGVVVTDEAAEAPLEETVAEAVANQEEGTE
jgi:small subunit ribosomal protein S2